MKRILILCVLLLCACTPVTVSTSRELAAVETERVVATQSVAQIQAADATWDAQNVTLRQLDIEQTALAVRREIAVLEMTREAAPANATSTAVANIVALAEAKRADDVYATGVTICGSLLFIGGGTFLATLLWHGNREIADRRAESRRVREYRISQTVALLPGPHIVTETTPDASANHVAEWRAALRRCIEWGQLIGFTEAEWRRLAIVHYPEDPAANDDIGRRSLMRLLDTMGVTFARRGRERTWAAGWSADTPLSAFARLPLPSELPEGGCPSVKIALRSAEAGEFSRSSELLKKRGPIEAS